MNIQMNAIQYALLVYLLCEILASVKNRPFDRFMANVALGICCVFAVYDIFKVLR